MTDEPRFGGRDRARGTYQGPYGADTRPSARCRRAADTLPLFPATAPAPIEPSPPSAAYLTGTLRLTARIDWIDWAVLPEPDPEARGFARLWRLEAPGCVPFEVGELADPDEGRGAIDPRYRGLWCSCAIFAAHGGCNHVEDLAAAGLLRPDLLDWDDLEDLAAANLGGWDLVDRADLDLDLDIDLDAEYPDGGAN